MTKYIYLCAITLNKHAAIMCAQKGKVFILSVIIILCDFHRHARKIVRACLATQDTGHIQMAALGIYSFVFYCEYRMCSHNSVPPG